MRTGLEPATPGVTGRYSNRLNYRTTEYCITSGVSLITGVDLYRTNLDLMHGSSLLSHGEAPHYHRRCGVSLLSSAWGQVGPPRSCRPNNLLRCCCGRIRITQSHTAVCSFLMSHLPPCFSATSFVSADFFYPVNKAENRLSSSKRLWRCKVKPHGSLVPVSSTHRCAYTPGLSTSSSSTSLQGPGKTHLEASFVLRCFQHLSLPHLATGQCHWHDNPNTSGAFTPVLSY